MVFKKFVKCKSCGHEWEDEKLNTYNMYYCPKCGMIGHLNEQFILSES